MLPCKQPRVKTLASHRAGWTVKPSIGRPGSLRVQAIAQPPPPTKDNPREKVSAPVPDAPIQLFPSPGQATWPPKRPFAAIALDQLLDSAADVGKHIRRMGYQDKVTQEAADLEQHLVPGNDGRLRLGPRTKPIVLVLGSGWGAHAIIKVIDTDNFDVVVVSPRNHFVFTPMLPSTAVGTVEFRSLLEPIRTSNPCITYLEAECTSIDVQSKVASCISTFARDDGSRPEFEVQYDKIVVAVGERPATFGVPGVHQHCFFMKEISDAVALRKKIGEKFELASLPGTSEEERKSALHFVVVGGGPTGVEFAGTLADFLSQDLKAKYPALMKHVRVTLLQSGQAILTQFDARLAQQAVDNLVTSGVEVRTGVRVMEVTASQVILKGGEALDYGVCVWSTGNEPRPLVSSIASLIPDQAAAAQAAGVAPNSKLVVDSFLRVIGARDMMCLGDCSLVLGNRLPATAQVAAQQGSYLAHLINSKYELGVGGYAQPPPYTVVKRNRLEVATDMSPQMRWLRTAIAGGKERVDLALEVSNELDIMDAPPWVRAHSEAIVSQDGDSIAATASAQQYLPPALMGAPSLTRASSTSTSSGSSLMSRDRGGHRVRVPTREVHYYDRPFEFLSLGIMAYVGNNRALTEVEAFDVINLRLYGGFAYLLWRSVYITKQVSFRNRVLILFDWLKTRVFGRDISLF